MASRSSLEWLGEHSDGYSEPSWLSVGELAELRSAGVIHPENDRSLILWVIGLALPSALSSGLDTSPQFVLISGE